MQKPRRRRGLLLEKRRNWGKLVRQELEAPNRAYFAATELTLCAALMAVVASAAAGCSAGAMPQRAHCVASEAVAEFASGIPGGLDVLFVVSDTPSMADEQAVLQQQLPALVHALAVGASDDEYYLPAAQDLHVAVVSATLADGAELHRLPTDGVDACGADYPAFLHYRGPYFGPNHDDPAAFVADFDCSSRLGADSLDRHQPFEAALVALSNPNSRKGFLRNDASKGLSLIAVVAVTDSDDCSTARASIAGAAPPATTAACAQREAELESVGHYAQALRTLRPDNPELVAFSAITGVPPALVDHAALATVDLSDERQRETFYRRIYNDPAMQAVVDPSSPERLQPACSSARASAQPAPRIVQFAESFGANGRVTSICNADWRAALVPLTSRFAQRRAPQCLGRAQQRGADGKVACKMYWNLPSPEVALDGTPTRCRDRPYLRPAPGEPRVPGGQRCQAQQLAIANQAELAALDPQAGGWFYDDFSKDVMTDCLGPQRVSYTEFAAPQAGIVVTVDCPVLQVLPTGDAAVDDATSCGVPETLAAPPRGFVPRPLIGNACMPAQIPERGFLESEVTVESNGSQCERGACLVYHLEGDPLPDCLPKECPGEETNCVPRKCAAPMEVEDRMYCSCRCAAADPAVGTCACPAGFSCREVFAESGPGFDGSYCVKDGTFEERP